MLLVVDVGNTNTVIGVFDAGGLRAHWRIETRGGRTSDEYAATLHELFAIAELPWKGVDAGMIATVVPPVLFSVEKMFKDHFKVQPLVVGPGLKTGMPILYDNPREVGADRIVNAVAAYERWKQGCIIVDFGTATTFDLVTQKGEYAGGAIAPGPITAADALYEAAAKLPRVEIARPPSVIGKNTVHSMQAGLYFGYVGLVDEIVSRMRAAVDYPCKVIATGGLAPLIAKDSRTIEEADEMLTLVGLRLLLRAKLLMPPVDLTPLETLPPSVDKVVGEKAPAALKLMAARGLAPLGPADLATAIYQLVQTGDDTVKQAANKSALELPEKILGAALAEPLDVRVLDFFARRVWQKPKLLEIILLNRTTDDRTFRHLATLCSENELELIAKNEERLLRHPDIIAALYLNPKTRMSTVQRAIEMAVRNGVRIDAIPAFDEAARAIEETGPLSEEQLAKEDAAFKKAAEVIVDPSASLMIVAVDEKEKAAMEAAEAEKAEAAAATEAEAEEEKKTLKDLSTAAKIRAATLGNAFARAVLIRDTNKQVSMACIRSPGVSDSEAMHYAANRSLDDDIIRFIANNRPWLRLYGIKVALVNNPKCPMGVSMRLLPHLNVRDLKSLARSKGIPSALATAAKQMLTQRNA